MSITAYIPFNLDVDALLRDCETSIDESAIAEYKATVAEAKERGKTIRSVAVGLISDIKHREECARWREKNRDRINAHAREYHWANRERIIARKRAYYAANRERILERDGNRNRREYMHAYYVAKKAAKAELQPTTE